MQASETVTVAEFIATHRISMKAERVDTNPNMLADIEWMRDASHWRCVLRCGGRQFTVPFSQGSAHTREPTAEDVLDTLASDASSVENSSGYHDWRDEFGAEDTPEMRRTYDLIKRHSAGLERLLGSTRAFLTLLNDTERL